MSVQQGTQPTRKHFLALASTWQARWPLFARALWLTLVVLTLTIFFGSLPLYRSELQTTCTNPPCVYFQLTAQQVQTLHGVGWSVGAYATLQIVLWLVSIGVTLGVSTLIVWRRSSDRMAMLVALLLVTLGPINATTGVLPRADLWQIANLFLGPFLGVSLYLLVFLLFPSGQFVPRWSRWILVINMVTGPVLLFIHPRTLNGTT